MRFLDLSKDESIPQLQSLLRRITRTDSSRDAVHEFFGNYAKVRPIERFTGVIALQDRPGAYKVFYDVPTTGMCDGLATQMRDRTCATLDALPVLEGGLVGSLIAEDGPKLALDLEVTGDPVFGDSIADMRSVVALPIYVGDRVAEWSLAFSRKGAGLDANVVSQAFMNANLLALAARNMDAIAEIKHLNTRLSDQLEQVARLQQAILPERVPRIPGLEIATSYLTSDQSGGDYYGFSVLPGGRFGVGIADVSGHGAAAATVGAMLHAIMGSFAALQAEQALDPARVLTFANQRLVETSVEGSFVTAFMGVYNPKDDRLVYSSAGHNPPRIVRSNGKIEAISDAAGVPLGIVDGVSYENGSIGLRAADTLVLYTDGIVELFDAGRKRMFGYDRLDNVLSRSGGLPDRIVDLIHAAMFEHRGSATRDDDQTIVAIRRSTPGGGHA